MLRDKEFKILSMMIRDHKTIPFIRSFLKDMYDFTANATYKAILKLKDNNEIVNIINLSREMGMDVSEAKKHYEGLLCLTNPGDYQQADAYVDEYLEERNEKEIIETAEKMQELFDNGMTNRDIAQKFMEIANRERQKEKVWSIGEAVYETVEELSSAGNEIIKTGFKSLDFLINLRRGNLAIISARPKVGKTTMALNMAYRMAMGKRKVLFLSFEMRVQEITQKLINLAAQTSQGNIADRSRNIGKVGDNLAIVDGYTMPIPRIRALIKKMKPDVVFIDQLDCLLVDKKLDRHDLRVGANVMELKAMAQELQIVIVLLHQLNRGSEKEEKPELYHLKDSSVIEQKCDVAMLLWSKESSDMPSRIYCSVAANRMGGTGEVPMMMFKPQSRIEEV
jgi:replicative DNA helicase